MPFSRVFFPVVLLVALFVCLTSAQTTDPPLYCSVFSLQPFAAIVNISGVFPGASLASSTSTTYGNPYYYVTLSPAATNNYLVLNTQSSSGGNVSYSVAYGIYVAPSIVDNRFITDPTTGLAAVFTYTPGGDFIDLNPFIVSSLQPVTYVITVNLTQVVIGPSGLNNDPARFDGCTATDYFFITNPIGTPSNTSGFGGSSTGGSGVVGDPQIVGLRGQSFQVHGIDGALYNLISDHDIQVNSRFGFLTGPRDCPVLQSTGKKSVACFAHSGSYLTEIGVKTSAGDRLFIGSGPAKLGFNQVTLNGEAIPVGTVDELHHDDDIPDGFVSYNNTHELVVSAGQFVLTIENVDGFLNLRSVHVHDWRSLRSHGLLGQTWRARRYSGRVKEIEGEVDDYVVLDEDIFGDNFVFNQHNVDSRSS